MGDGWNQTTGRTDHAQAMRYARQLTPAAADYVRRDCLAAAAAHPDNAKAGHYADLASYCGMRLFGTL